MISEEANENTFNEIKHFALITAPQWVRRAAIVVAEQQGEVNLILYNSTALKHIQIIVE